MGYGIKVKISGEYALFSRLDMKTERVSFDVITPSSARGILEAVFWKPAIKYHIDKIHVYNEPQFTNLRRNEVSEKIMYGDMLKLMQNKPAKTYLCTKDIIQQRSALILKNVCYIIEAHFVMTDKAGERDTEEKHYNMILRRLRKGQCYHQPYLGCREFPAKVEIVEDDVPKSGLAGKRDLGYMLYDLDYSDPENISPMFFRAVMNDGIIDLTNVEIRR